MEEVVVPPEASEQSLMHDAALRILGDGEGQETSTEEVSQETEQTETTETATTEQTAPKTEEKTPELRKFKVPIREEDGTEQELEVEEPELIKGYIRQRVYQQKASEIAKERQAIKEEIKKGVDPTLKQYQEQLQTYEKAVWQALAPEIQGTDWNKLAAENPAEWAVKMQRVNNVNAVLQGVQQESRRVAEQQQKEFEAKTKESAKEAVDVLRREIPGWNNEIYGKVLKTGKDYGFSPEELNAITDPRAIRALNDARLYRELKSQKPQVDKKVAAVPKVGKPGTTEKPDQGREQWNQGMAQLKKSGSTQDAVKLAKLFLK